MQNYKKQSKVPIQKFPGDLSSFSDEKIFFLSYAMVSLEFIFL